MPHVVTQACCGDASCVYACPVNCIHPTPDEPDFGIAEMLYIDPNTCVDCGACVTACPVGAITPSHRLTPGQERFVDINAEMYAPQPDTSTLDMADPLGLTAARFPVDPGRRLPLAPVGHPEGLAVDGPVSIGIVGSGPSAMYAADELLRHHQVSVTMYERLDRPFGLARFGVAPDHGSTRTVMRLFDDVASNPALEIRLRTEVGRDVTLAELRARHSAVIWAGGAPTDRPLTLPGAEALGVTSATSFVGWYNDHPDFTDLAVGLRVREAVVIGTGNVALDVARILVRDPDDLAGTPISRHALTALRTSGVRRVTVLGRRGAEHAAFTLPELVGLVDGGIPVTVDAAEVPDPTIATDPTTRTKLRLLREIAARPVPTEPHIRFAFDRTPDHLEVDNGRVGGISVTRPDGSTERLEAGLVLAAIGYRGRPVPGLPFDESTGTIRHRAGRIVDADGPVPGMYVTGWIKRGPSGFIGTNKTDSTETVTSLLADLEAGRLPRTRTARPRRTLLRVGRG
ncbi:4Fe-4S binding protein [Gordonia sp. NB41Y]|uniref:4Fe-4S binding protein n=1 Tax=Gordonia sp. NB41Y TaxID=875808 RepID=UPI0006B179AB|nr:4Fe-4S binding protein [Gordonia sp. NB41Y]KOY49732.1 4Fe-4S ferredoxin [Gordonia sp. NB41Y]WLP91832.1 4Fe-4S binding protein [Gordonia sp. NB41Y]